MPGTQRLTSYRLPRDLTLGGNIKPERPKKVYTPNLNVQRNRKKEEATPVKIDVTKPTDKDGKGARGNRGDNRHGRNKANIIQTTGIWSDGIYTAPNVSRRSYASSSSSDNKGTKKYLEKSKLNMKKFVKEEDDEKLKKLLDDDLIDDGTNIDDKMDPISLPRVVKEDFSDEEVDTKPLISKYSEVVNIKEETLSKQDNKEISISQIIENKTNPYVLMQFPACWGDLESNKEETKPKNLENSDDTFKNDKEVKNEYYGLNNLKSGLIGKLEILQSGKARLRVGEKCFSININVQDFQQELLAAKVDTVSLSGDLVNLGAVNNQLLCLPDLETMLKNS